jgi:predicted AlkP superfamily pyrophosphatase or phosphodiesterase
MRIALPLLGFAAALMAATAPAAAHKLLVVSVDGLDWRYLRDRDQLGLKIPTLRHLMAQGWTADGVVGVWPTITWPSHSSIVTGARVDQHGIRGNQRPKAEGGDYYWTPDLLRVPTLWQCMGEHGRTTASITWPVTKGAKIGWDLPEYFKRRNGGSMDLETAASAATPGMVEAITAAYPSFAQQWIDDRTRTLATLWLLKAKQPDLILVHLVDLDSEAHDRGPFEQNANAVLERTDELLGDLVRALPAGYDLVVTSDHGFERLDHIANPAILMAEQQATGSIEAMGGIVVARDAAGAVFLRAQAKAGREGFGREIPHAELTRVDPELGGVAAAFEPAAHYMFGPATSGAYLTLPRERGEHGFWPLRQDYRSVFVAYGPGIAPAKGPEIEMTSIRRRLADLLDAPACR